MNEINTKKDIIQSFYFNGFIVANIKKSEIHSKFLQTIKKININVEKNKYFRPINRNVFSNTASSLADSTIDQSKYLDFLKKNPVFFEILLANGIPNLIETVFGKKLLLRDISIRKVFKERKLLRQIIKPWGYIGPHRDVYFKKNRWRGAAPPGCRVFFYPQLSDKDNTEEKMIELYPSSHRKMTNFSNGKFIDFLRSFIDKKYSIIQSNNEIVIMNSATRHSIVKEKNKQGTMRVLYFFEDPITYKKHNFKLNEILNEISFSIKQDSLNTIKNIKNYY